MRSFRSIPRWRKTNQWLLTRMFPKIHIDQHCKHSCSFRNIGILKQGKNYCFLQWNGIVQAGRYTVRILLKSWTFYSSRKSVTLSEKNQNICTFCQSLNVKTTEAKISAAQLLYYIPFIQIWEIGSEKDCYKKRNWHSVFSIVSKHFNW